MPPTVVAIIAAYNERDIIGQVVGALIDDGIQVYFIDDASTDGTLAEVERWRGRGVIGIERLEDSGDRHAFAWERILRRKSELAARIDADWFLHHDADEFRESPWPGESLRAGITRVDRAGYNAIDFELFDFRPTATDSDVEDVRQRMRFCERGGQFDRLQIKCWKKTRHPVQLAPSGGHSADFPGRRVFPVRFLLRHYPIRSQAHGERKVFGERLPNFVEGERSRGWHVQYDTFQPGASFVRDAGSLVPFDADAARLQVFIRHRAIERLEHVALANEAHAGRLVDDMRKLAQHLATQDAELRRLRDLPAPPVDSERLAALEVERGRLESDLARRDRTVAALETSRRQLEGDLALRDRTVGALLASRSWRWTTWLRQLDRSRSRQDAPALPVAVFPVRRGVRLAGDVVGFWSDGWAGPRLSCRIVSSRPIQKLRIAGVVPAALVEGQNLQLAAEGRTWAHHADPGSFDWEVPLVLASDEPVEIVMTASGSWQPAADGTSTDCRDLAWQVRAVEAR